MARKQRILVNIAVSVSKKDGEKENNLLLPCTTVRRRELRVKRRNIEIEIDC